MKVLTNWKKTLQQVVYFHKEDTIEFSIKDVEEVLNVLITEEVTTETLKSTITNLRKSNERLKSQLLIAALDTPELREKVKNFKVYA